MWQVLMAPTSISSGSTAPGAAHLLPTTWGEAVPGTSTPEPNTTVWPRL